MKINHQESQEELSPDLDRLPIKDFLADLQRQAQMRKTQVPKLSKSCPLERPCLRKDSPLSLPHSGGHRLKINACVDLEDNNGSLDRVLMDQWADLGQCQIRITKIIEDHVLLINK